MTSGLPDRVAEHHDGPSDDPGAADPFRRPSPVASKTPISKPSRRRPPSRPAPGSPSADVSRASCASGDRMTPKALGAVRPPTPSRSSRQRQPSPCPGRRSREGITMVQALPRQRGIGRGQAETPCRQLQRDRSRAVHGLAVSPPGEGGSYSRSPKACQCYTGCSALESAVRTPLVSKPSAQGARPRPAQACLGRTPRCPTLALCPKQSSLSPPPTPWGDILEFPGLDSCQNLT